MKKRILSLFVALAMILPMTAGLTAVTASAAGETVVRLDPSDASPFNGGEFQGWGTSLCWWANRVGYSPSLVADAAEKFFSEDGLSLDIARYNLGGGDDPSHTHITRSDSKVPGVWDTFELSEDEKNVTITYDITKDQRQLNVAKAALAANPDLYFEGFSNSAPYFMTITGCSAGGGIINDDGTITPDGSKNNLKDDMYDDFAKFIADATLLFKKEGIVFRSYSPMNEPDTDYWPAYHYKQEGCHFDPGEKQSKMIVETRNALNAKGLNNVLVAGMDETSIDKSVSNLDKLTDDAKTALGRIDTHTYSGSKRTQLKDKAIAMNKDLWMSEVDKDFNGLGLAQRIIDDLNGMQAAAWVIWDIIDIHKDSTSALKVSGEENATLNVTGAPWGVGMANHDTGKLELANKYYFFGQFTKYINPGDTIIASSGNTLAAYNKKSGDIKIVALNSGSSDQAYTFDLRAFTHVGDSVKEIRTNNATGANAEHWKEIEGEATLENKLLSTTLKAGTVTTFVVEDEPATAVTEFEKSEDGVSYEYTVSPAHEEYDKYFAVYDSGALKAVTKNETKGTLTGDFANSTFKLLVWDGMEPVEVVATVTTPDAPNVDYMTISGATTVVVGVDYNYTAALGSSDEAPTVTWTVSDEEAAEVTAEGILTAKKGGSFTLTATTTDGAYTSIEIKALATDQTLRIVNKKSGLGLETKAKSIKSGATLVQYENRNLDTGAWKLAPTSDGKFNIINANANYLLVNSDGLKISSEVEGTNDNAKWELKNHGGYYEIYNIGADKSLNVSGQSTANGGSVILYTYGGGDNELWSFEEVTGTLEHVVPEQADYSKKYTDTNYNFVRNVTSATNDFDNEELNGFETSGSAKLSVDDVGELVLAIQSNFSNKENVGETGGAELALDPALTCDDGQIINISFDLFCSNSGGTADFTIYGDDEETNLVNLIVSEWDHFDIKVGDAADATRETNGAKTYLRNSVNDNRSGGKNQKIENGGHFEIYYTPSTGAIKVTLKNNTNNSATKVYEGTVAENTSISKLAFNANYTTWSKPMYLDNLITNIITEKNNN